MFTLRFPISDCVLRILFAFLPSVSLTLCVARLWAAPNQTVWIRSIVLSPWTVLVPSAGNFVRETNGPTYSAATAAARSSLCSSRATSVLPARPPHGRGRRTGARTRSRAHGHELALSTGEKGKTVFGVNRRMDVAWIGTGAAVDGEPNEGGGGNCESAEEFSKNAA